MRVADLADSLLPDGSNVAPGLLRDMEELITGSSPLNEILAELLLRGHDLSAVLSTFEALEKLALVGEAEPLSREPSPDEARFGNQIRALDMMSRGALHGGERGTGLAAQRRLLQSMVMVLDDGDDRWGEWARAALVAAGVGRVPRREFGQEADLHSLREILDTTSPDVVLYAPALFDRTVAAEVNRLCVELGRAATFYNHSTMTAEVGPFVLPGETACYECLETRISGARGPDRRIPAEVRAHLNVALGLDTLCLDIAKHLTGLMSPLTAGHLLLLDIWVGTHELHPVLKIPRCSVCGLGERPPSTLLWETTPLSDG